MQGCVPGEQLGRDNRSRPEHGGRAGEDPEPTQGDGQGAPVRGELFQRDLQLVDARAIRIDRQCQVRRVAELVRIGVDARRREASPHVLDCGCANGVEAERDCKQFGAGARCYSAISLLVLSGSIAVAIRLMIAQARMKTAITHPDRYWASSHATISGAGPPAMTDASW
jgi:hypothetical protein